MTYNYNKKKHANSRDDVCNGEEEVVRYILSMCLYVLIYVSCHMVPCQWLACNGLQLSQHMNYPIFMCYDLSYFYDLESREAC